MWHSVNCELKVIRKCDANAARDRMSVHHERHLGDRFWAGNDEWIRKNFGWRKPNSKRRCVSVSDDRWRTVGHHRCIWCSQKGDELRPSGYYRMLNARTITDRYPVPHFQSIRVNVSYIRFVCTFDTCTKSASSHSPAFLADNGNLRFSCKRNVDNSSEFFNEIWKLKLQR